MKLLTIDFETYYDSEYSLSRMSTEDYINDHRFEVILVSVQVGGAEPTWFSGTKAKTCEWLSTFDIPNSGVVLHNAMFDALILQHVFDMRPAFIFDTLSMAQAILKPFTGSVSLKSCLEHCDFDGLRKGVEVHNMLGRTRGSLSPGELAAYSEYCCTDVRGTYLLFQHLKPYFPKSEFLIMDRTHRMYLDPQLELHAPLLAEILQEERSKKAQLLAGLESRGVTKAVLMSNEKFASMLVGLGVDPPMKISPATGKETYAFAKSDPGFKALEEDYSDDPVVSAMLTARLSLKSTISETRAERLLDIARKYKKLRVPLNYYAAHTGRYGGTQKINMQNPPRTDKSRMRFAMVAPKGHVVLGADLSQIEARVVSWLAGCQILVDGFAAKKDIYSEFAAHAYREEVKKGRSKEDDARRFVGKTCILGLGYGMGADKLKSTLNKDGVKIDVTEAQRLVTTYRSLYKPIPDMWWKFDRMIGTMASRTARGAHKGVVEFLAGQVTLPNGMPMYYRDLRKNDVGDWVYTYGRETRKLFGGKLTENITQALARIVVMDNMATIERELGLQMALQVHDELDYVVPEGQAGGYAKAIVEIMAIPPKWAPDLPVAAEVHFGPTFGDCK